MLYFLTCPSIEKKKISTHGQASNNGHPNGRDIENNNDNNTKKKKERENKKKKKKKEEDVLHWFGLTSMN